MSIESLHNRNLSRARVASLDQVFLQPNKEQTQLTEAIVLPNIELILEDVKTLRHMADVEIKDTKSDKAHNYGSPYPVGRCKEITNFVLDHIMEGLEDPSLQGVRILRKFVKEGGTIRQVWVIDNKEYFQNVIQIGSAILDVANNTFDTVKEPIVFLDHMTEGTYEAIDSLERFADVAETYWNERVYPNIYFPALAPIFPMLARKKLYHGSDRSKETGLDGLFFEAGQSAIVHRNQFTLREEGSLLFGMTHDFLFASKYSSRRLPKSVYAQMLENKGFALLHKQTRGEFFVSDDPEKAEEYLRSIYNMDISDQEFYDRINGMLAVRDLLGRRPLATFQSSIKDNEQE